MRLETIYWAGCNYNVNRVGIDGPTDGTATSMHDCGDCEHLPDCEIKKEAEVWAWDESYRKIVNDEVKRLRNLG